MSEETEEMDHENNLHDPEPIYEIRASNHIRATSHLKPRQKGTPNNVTTDAKRLFVQILENQVGHLEDALDKVRERSPAKYVDLIAKLAVYFVPKKLDITTDGNQLNYIPVAKWATEEGNAIDITDQQSVGPQDQPTKEGPVNGPEL